MAVQDGFSDLGIIDKLEDTIKKKKTKKKKKVFSVGFFFLPVLFLILHYQSNGGYIRLNIHECLPRLFRGEY